MQWWKRTAEDPTRRYIADHHPQEDERVYCMRRIGEEEALAQDAGSWEAGLIHEQAAMLYRAQLATLSRDRGDADGAQSQAHDGAATLT